MKGIVDAYIAGGGTAFMDIVAFATLYGYDLVETRATGIAVLADSPICSTFRKGQVVSYGDKSIYVLATLRRPSDVIVLGGVSDHPALVEMRTGKGRILAVDLRSIPEPCFEERGSLYTNPAINSVAFWR